MASPQNLERTNCFRVCCLLLNGGMQLMLLFIKESIGISTLDSFLAVHQSKLHALHTRKHKPVISKEQWAVLYPPGGGGTDTQTWDITLTTCVITNLMYSMTFQQEQAIKDIRELRNELYGHIGTFQIDTTKFNHAWKRVKQTLDDSAKCLLSHQGDFDLNAIINDIQTQAVTDVNTDNVKSMFVTWKARDMAVIDAVTEQGRKLDNISKAVADLKLREERKDVTDNDVKDLQTSLVEYYKDILTKAPIAVQSSYSETDIDDIYAEPHLVHVDHRARATKGTEKKISVNDIFQQNRSTRQHIYISGDAGAGKTSLCKHLIDAWCRALSQDQSNDRQDIIKTMRQFDFLFFVSLRDIEGQFEIRRMIEHQLLDSLTKGPSDHLLASLLEDNDKKCLIILDGLDEWTSPRKSQNLYSGRKVQRATTLVTSRPWKIGQIIKEKDIDKQIELRGVESVEKFGRRLVAIYNKQATEQKSYDDFKSTLTNHGLEKMKDIPILLKQLICLWFHRGSIGNSKTDVYAMMLELLFELAEKRDDFNTDIPPRQSDIEIEKMSLPTCFGDLDRCQLHKVLIHDLAKLGFRTFFGDKNDPEIVFTESTATRNDVCRSKIDICLAVGILTKSFVHDNVCERISLAFIHKSFHVFFAALFLSMCSSIGKDVLVGRRCKSSSDVYNTEDMREFIFSMSPSILERKSPNEYDLTICSFKASGERNRRRHGNIHRICCCLCPWIFRHLSND